VIVSLLFVVAVFSIMGKSSKSSENDFNKSKLLNLSNTDIDHSKSGDALYVRLDKMVLSKLDMTVVYASFKDCTNPLPYSAYTLITGLMGGHDWKATINVTPSSDPKHFAYTVDGVLKWKLLGVAVYSQPKSYNGFFDIP